MKSLISLAHSYSLSIPLGRGGMIYLMLTSNIAIFEKDESNIKLVTVSNW